MWVKYNDNPIANKTTDCTTRAIGVALDIPWEKAYVLLSSAGFSMGLVPFHLCISCFLTLHCLLAYRNCR